jgi:oligoendopeptidase F
MKQYNNNIKILSIVMMSIFILIQCNTPVDKLSESVEGVQISKNRGNIPEKYKWNLADMYASLDDWNKVKEEFPVKFEKVGSYKGTLGKSANNLFNALEYMENVVKELSVFSSYASMLSDEDKRIS